MFTRRGLSPFRLMTSHENHMKKVNILTINFKPMLNLKKSNNSLMGMKKTLKSFFLSFSLFAFLCDLWRIDPYYPTLKCKH